MELVDALDAGVDAFRRGLTCVGGGDWGRPTPCAEWDVRYLVAHVVGGNRFGTLILGGASADDALAEVLRGRVLGDDPVADLDAGYAELRAALTAPGALDGTVSHVSGVVPARHFLEMRVYDLALHAWDLARAVGADDTLAPDLVATTLAVVTAWDGSPEGPAATPAATQDRLLAVTGRDPAWSPPP